VYLYGNIFLKVSVFLNFFKKARFRKNQVLKCHVIELWNVIPSTWSGVSYDTHLSSDLQADFIRLEIF